MINKVFSKITQVNGGAASVTSPKFTMAKNSAVVFLIGASNSPLTVTAKGYKGEDTEKAIPFRIKELTKTDWETVNSDGLQLAETDAFLVAITANALAHDELEGVTLALDGGENGSTPETIFAFKIATRYIPE